MNQETDEISEFGEIEGLKYAKIPNTALGLPENNDLLPGEYEGGLKVWECSVDLLRFLKSKPIPRTVLELGCGQGLPGIYCLSQGAQVTFQDFNDFVLESATKKNILENIGTLENASFCQGDWKDLKSIGKFDLIVSSDTIYSPENYDHLLGCIHNSLSGTCLISCKSFYFGIGGSYFAFLNSAQSFGFSTEILQTISDGVYPRYIISLSLDNN